jgi:ABC-type nitrate/sulfonate/bicarbonate transport system ATPase subunit
MRQRRSPARRPANRNLLMDEPFGARQQAASSARLWSVVAQR